MKVAVDQNREALIFRNRIDSEIRAKVCADCGYVSFYAIHPEHLWTAYQMKKKDL